MNYEDLTNIIPPEVPEGELFQWESQFFYKGHLWSKGYFINMENYRILGIDGEWYYKIPSMKDARGIDFMHFMRDHLFANYYEYMNEPFFAIGGLILILEILQFASMINLFDDSAVAQILKVRYQWSEIKKFSPLERYNFIKNLFPVHYKVLGEDAKILLYPKERHVVPWQYIRMEEERIQKQLKWMEEVVKWEKFNLFGIIALPENTQIKILKMGPGATNDVIGLSNIILITGFYLSSFLYPVPSIIFFSGHLLTRMFYEFAGKDCLIDLRNNEFLIKFFD